MLDLLMRMYAMQADLHQRKVPERRAPCRDQRGESPPVRCSIPLAQHPCHDWPSSDRPGAHVQDGGPPELHEALLLRQAGGQELFATDEAQSRHS
jgi:hypothetical protein